MMILIVKFALVPFNVYFAYKSDVRMTLTLI